MTLIALMTVTPITTSPALGCMANMTAIWIGIGVGALFGATGMLGVWAHRKARNGRRDEIERNARMNAFASHLRQRRLQRALRPDVKRTARG